MSDTDVKNIIINAATKYFSKYGFHKTTVDEIAKHIHKAKGVIYYYFRSKEELFNEVLKHELNQIKSELTKIANEKTDALSILEKYTITRYKLLNKAYNYHETLKADFFEKYHFVKEVRDDFADFEHNQLSFILKKGINEGQVLINNDFNTYVKLILIIINSLEIPFFLQNNFDKYEDNIKGLAHLLFEGLKNKKLSL